MRWEAWILVILYCVGIIIQISQVGKPRPTLTGGLVAFSAAINTSLAYLIVRLGVA